jgi:hypothetical protein
MGRTRLIATMAAYVLETVLCMVTDGYPQRVYRFAFSKSRFARHWPSSMERFGGSNKTPFSTHEVSAARLRRFRSSGGMSRGSCSRP